LRRISVLDTSIATKNLGDEIIVDSVYRELNDIFKHDTMFFKVPTHERISRHSHRIINSSEYSFVAGTNILSSKYNIIKSNLWNINIYDAIKINRIVLMGVGWGDYQSNPSFLSKLLYDKVLDKNVFHSVRDSYTKKKLETIGVVNVINTGCPTIWQLTPEFCSGIPSKKARDVVCTLTDYRIDKEKDKVMIDILNRYYENVYFWIQGSKDLEYVQTISSSVKIVGPSLYAYDKLLSDHEDIDYIGTRLHAGIRAMQKKKRTIIIGIDNRALEKKKDFGINVVNRNEISSLPDIVSKRMSTNLTIDFASINKWKEQFR
jgi:polysaccharide pyruvyl transferase WcaK-like protein